MASRNNRISEGHLPLYGKTELGAADHMTFWRQRVHNEQVGCPVFDRFGSNAGLSLLWRPDAPRQPQTMYAYASHKRHAPPEFRDIGSAATAARGAPRLPPTAAAALGSVMPPPRTPLPAQATPHLPATDGFLCGEGERLTAAHRARELGQTFLRAGNLTQAKVQLKRAEELLWVGGAASECRRQKAS